ncbi:hypothetical protein ACWEF6_02520 [Amycolatopsis sp. NPDC004772]
MSPRAFVGIVGAAVVLLGLVLLFVPVSMTVAGETGTCDDKGAFHGLPSELLFNNRAYEAWQDQCASATSTRQAWSWGLVGVGVVVAAGSSMVRRPTPPATPATN